MIETIDGFFAGVLHKVLVVLCKLTGRSNYFFAITTLVCSLLLKLLYFGTRFSEHKFNFTDGVFWILTIISTTFMITWFCIDKKKIESSTDVLNVSTFNSPVWRPFRSMLLLFNLLFLLLDSVSAANSAYLSSLSNTLYFVGLYFAADTIPRGKGWLAKTIRKIVTAAKKPVHIPSPIPLPPPIPS